MGFIDFIRQKVVYYFPNSKECIDNDDVMISDDDHHDTTDHDHGGSFSSMTQYLVILHLRCF